MVEVTGATPLLVAVNAPISPFPLVPNPTSIDDVHEKSVPFTGPLILIVAAASPLQ